MLAFLGLVEEASVFMEAVLLVELRVSLLLIRETRRKRHQPCRTEPPATTFPPTSSQLTEPPALTLPATASQVTDPPAEILPFT